MKERLEEITCVVVRDDKKNFFEVRHFFVSDFFVSVQL